LRVEAGEVLADDLLGFVALVPLGPGVPGHNSSVWVEHEDRIVSCALNQQAKLIGLLSGSPLFLKEVDESTHLDLDNERHERLHKEIDGTQGIAAFNLGSVDVVGCQ